MNPFELWDPLGHAEPLPLMERYFPAGFPLDLRTNSGDVLAAACEGWGEFVAEFETRPVELRVIVKGPDPDPPIANPDGPVFRSQGHLVAIVLGVENFAVCDLDRGFGFASLTPGVARNHLFTSFHFLEGMAYVCLCQQHLTPVHAACVARDGKGILLVGDSFAGKSSLAWACSRAGLAYVCDDVAWLLRNASEPTVIGKPQRMRFRPEALDLLPDLAAIPRIETVIGKRSFEIRTADVPGLATARRCRASQVIFLVRQEDGPAGIVPIKPEQTQARLGRARALCEPHVWLEQEASIRPLAAKGGLELRYSSLTDAVEQILKIA